MAVRRGLTNVEELGDDAKMAAKVALCALGDAFAALQLCGQ